MRAVLLSLLVAAVALAAWRLIGAADKKPSRPRASQAEPAKAKIEASDTASTDRSAENGERTETAVFAGGCFWCTEFAFEQLDGVLGVESGYCGGTKGTANYDQVHLGITGHAEAVRVIYDPDKITYDDLLNVFFDAHDPTQFNRQGEDEGRQYRSAIFYADEEQHKQAEAKIADLKARKVYKRRIATKLEPLKEFYPAEDYHQDFARRNPFLPYIRGHAVPKALRVRNKHPDLIRGDETPSAKSNGRIGSGG